MNGPSNPHFNTEVDELYVAARGEAVAALPHSIFEDLDLGRSVYVARETPHGIVPLTQVFECYLITVPRYSDDNLMMAALEGERGWSELHWAMGLGMALTARGISIAHQLPVSREIEIVTSALTIP
jgi:hypothetical protein